MRTGGMRAMRLKATRMSISGRNHFAHFSQGTLATPSTPIVTAEVGRMGLTTSHSWKARTVVWRVIPTRSLSGAMTGMVRAAWAVPEWTKKLMTHCETNMIWAEMTGLNWEMAPANAARIVSMILPSWATM